MGMYDAASDRDYAEEMHCERSRQFQRKVPCAICRRPIWIETRTDYGQASWCDRCQRERAIQHE